MKKLFIFLFIVFLVFGLVNISQSTLILRGQGTSVHGIFNLIYDDDLNITWYDYTHNPHDISSGIMGDTWANQINWAENLSVIYNGETYEEWRLPTAVDGDWVSGYEGPDNNGNYSYTGGFNLANSEMGHLFYDELGNNGYRETSGNYLGPGLFGLNNTGDFDNLIKDTGNKESHYWTGTNATPPSGTNSAWDFNFYNGQQNMRPQTDANFAIALIPGDVAAPVPDPVPEPATLMLLGSGLISLIGFRRKFKK